MVKYKFITVLQDGLDFLWIASLHSFDDAKAHARKVKRLFKDTPTNDATICIYKLADLKETDNCYVFSQDKAIYKEEFYNGK